MLILLLFSVLYTLKLSPVGQALPLQLSPQDFLQKENLSVLCAFVVFHFRTLSLERCTKKQGFTAHPDIPKLMERCNTCRSLK
jgi:hypothetical protein